MKYWTFIILIIFTLTNRELKAQEIGIQTGMGLSTIRKPSIIYGDIPMFSFGINCYFGLKIGTRFYGTIEPGYIQKGAEDNSDGRHRKNKLDIISIPLTIGIDLYKSFYFIGGVEVNRLINHRQMVDGKLIIEFIPQKKYDFPIIIGIRKDFYSKFRMELRYSHSFIHLSEIYYARDIFDYTQTIHLIIAFRMKRFQ